MRYARHLLAGDIPGARLAAVHRRTTASGESFAREHGIRHHARLESLVDDPDVALVVIALPPGEHAHAIERVARAGRGVLVEKPVAATVRDAERAASIAREAGVFAAVAQTLRFDPLLDAARSHLPALGALHFASWTQRFEPTLRGWLDEPEHGGLVLNTGVHGVDALRYLTGARVISAHARAQCVVTAREPDVFAAVLTLEPGGVLATLDNSRATHSRAARFELSLEHGQLWGDLLARRLTLVRGYEQSELEAPPAVPTVRDALAATVAAFIRGAREPVPIEEGVIAVEACALVRASIEAAGNAPGPHQGSPLS